MYINLKNLSMDMDSIAEETKIAEMLDLAYGDKIDDDKATEIAFSFYESIIVEALYEEQKSYWGKKYKELSDAKKELNCGAAEKKRAEIEDTAKDAIAEFLMYFDDLDCDKLTREIKKKFRYYRFKEINRVNDYTILYFTYKLFQIYCSEFTERSVEETAEQFAKTAYDRLNSKRGKKQTTVTCDNLITFLREFDLASPKRTYIEIFIDYIQDLYFSDIDDVLTYAVFSRFGTDLMLINGFLTALISTKSRSKNEKGSNEYLEPHKISKYVSNQKRSLKISEDKDAEEIKSLTNGLQREFSKFPKAPDELGKKTKSKFYQACLNIYDYVDQLLKYKRTKWEDTVSRIISIYRHLSFKGIESKIGIYNQVFIGVLYYCCATVTKVARKKKFNKYYLGGNIFLQLLLSTAIFEDKTKANSFNEMAKETIDFARGKLKYQLSSDITAEIEAFRTICQYVNLNTMQPAILNLHLPESYEYDAVISFIEKTMF